MEEMADEVLTFIDQMAPQHWIIVLAVAIGLGFLCLKSIGSRPTY